MAKKFKKMGLIKDTEGGNFGGYKEENGGGTPVGGHFGGPSGRVGWKERGEPGHRDEQPRTSDGKFTYNSVNGKETIYDGRGKTVNPLLTGGENGVKIDDVKSEFTAKSGPLYDKWKGKFYQAGSMKATKEGKKYVIKLSANDILECGRYAINAKTGEFGESKRGQKRAGLVPESQNWAQTKAGAPGTQGKIAKEEAKKTGSEQYVHPAFDKEAIAKFKGDNSAAGLATKLGLKAKATQLTHTPAQIKQVRDLMTKAGYDISGSTDEQIDAIVDQFITF